MLGESDKCKIFEKQENSWAQLVHGCQLYTYTGYIVVHVIPNSCGNFQRLTLPNVELLSNNFW